MKLKVIDSDDRCLKFEVSGINPVFANTIRRVLVKKIPLLAIETVDFIDNTSALYDEIIAHRLGLIPLVFDPKKFVFKDACKCKGKGCSSCQVKFVLKKDGPCIVYAKDLKSTDADVKPFDGDIVIVKLLENQSLSLEATAVLGTGEEHAKWQTAVVGYNYYPELKVNAKDTAAKACISACPRKLISSDFKLKKPYLCNFCGSCEDACPGVVTLTGDSTRIIFNVESVCGLSSKELVKQALGIMKINVGEFEEAFKKEIK